MYWKSKALKIIFVVILIFTGIQPIYAYFPYINTGKTGDALSGCVKITSVNISTADETDTEGSLIPGHEYIVSCRIKKTDSQQSEIKASLVVAAYNEDNILVGTSISDSVVLNNDNPVEISTLISVLESACKVKAFVWNNLELKPITKYADFSATEVNVLDVLLDGKSVIDELEAKDNKLNINLPASCTGLPDIQILTDNLAAKCEVKADKEINFTQYGETPENINITAKISIGDYVKCFNFTFTVSPPEITDEVYYKWKTSVSDTESEEYLAVEMHTPKKLLVKEASYDVGYTRSQLRENPQITKENGNNRLPTEFVSLHKNRPTWIMFDIHPELLGGVLLSTDYIPETDEFKLDADSLRGMSLGELKSFSFNINRSATIYVWNCDLNTEEFISEGYVKDYNLSLSFNNNGDKNLYRKDYWLKKRVIVEGDEPVQVNIPVGYRSMPVIVKFDEESFINNSTYTNGNGETDAMVIPVYEPVRADEDTVVDAIDDFIYWEKGFSNNSNSTLFNINEELIGGEMIALPYVFE